MTADFWLSDPQVLDNAAGTFEAQAGRLASEIEVINGLGIHFGGESLRTGANDLDVLIRGKMDEIVEALAGEGERLQQTSDNLTTSARNYRKMDGHVAGDMDTIHR